MTSKELKRLSRGELLEILIEQMEENDRLKEQIQEMQRKLEDRQIVLNEAGSIAEAALRLNGIFDAAQNAAKQYLESIQGMCADQDKLRESILQKAKAEAAAIRQSADAYSAKVRREADAVKNVPGAGAMEDQDDYWAALISEAKSLSGASGKRPEKETGR